MEYVKKCTYLFQVSLTICIVFPLQHILLCYDLPVEQYNNKRTLTSPSKKNTLIDIDEINRVYLFLKHQDSTASAFSHNDASNPLSVLGQAKMKEGTNDTDTTFLGGLLLFEGLHETNEISPEANASNGDMKQLPRCRSDSGQTCNKTTADFSPTHASFQNSSKNQSMCYEQEQLNTPKTKTRSNTVKLTSQVDTLKRRTRTSFRKRRSIRDTVIWSGVKVQNPTKNVFSPMDDLARFISTGLDDFDRSDIDVPEVCKRYPQSVLPHPYNCALFINCTVSPDAVMKTYYRSYVFECPYPLLFSELTMQCEDFGDVDCRGRFEPKSPCEYHSNQCHLSSHCIPCWARYVSCKGLADGLNPWRGKEWQPLFVECHRERTVFQGVCAPNAVFSPVTRACETPLTVPNKHGGWKPVCSGRRDGSYPDELGRCELFFVCKSQLFRGFHRCGSKRKFNPWTSMCERAETVPYPCGNRNMMPGLCRHRKDGNYLDVFGRCSHYFTCRNRVLRGIRVCPTVTFNVESRQCKGSENGAHDLQFQPCGERKNECFHRKDGEYAMGCHRRIVCVRGLVIAVLQTDPHDCLRAQSRRTKG